MKGSGIFIPALFRRISRRSRLATAEFRCSALVTSQTIGRARPPAAAIRFATCSSSLRVLLSRTTSAPAWARASAPSAPSPRPAPVTRATRPSSRKAVGSAGLSLAASGVEFRGFIGSLPRWCGHSRCVCHSGGCEDRPVLCVPRIFRWRRGASNTRRFARLLPQCTADR